MVANAERELSDPHVSGTATACSREMLSTIGSALHGSTAATASNFAMLSSALGIIGVTRFDAVVFVVVRFTATLFIGDESIVAVVDDAAAAVVAAAVVVVVDVATVAVVATASTTTFASFAQPFSVDQRLAFAGEQFACISPVSPQAPISYLRLVDVA